MPLITLTKKLNAEPQSISQLEALLTTQGYPRSAIDIWHGKIIDCTKTTPEEYNGQWSVHKHKTQPELYTAIASQGTYPRLALLGAYQVDISKLF